MKKIDELYELIEGIEIAMFTTRRGDGQLVSRPMATQARSEGADLWFVTDLQTHKMDELRFDDNVNVSYYKDASREWVSVSGTARVVSDRNKITELWRPEWKTWFPGKGEHAGTANDPRITLIAVDAESVVYMKNDKPRPVVLFDVVKGLMTDSAPEVGDVRRISRRELSAKE